jgi:hypothetical protein
MNNIVPPYSRVTINRRELHLRLIFTSFLVRNGIQAAAILVLTGVSNAQIPPSAPVLSSEERAASGAERAEYTRNKSLIARLSRAIQIRNASIKRLVNEVLALKEALIARGHFLPPEELDPPLFPPGAPLKAEIERQRETIWTYQALLRNRILIERRVRQRRNELRRELGRADREASARK